jgi:hypothetical protein
MASTLLVLPRQDTNYRRLVRGDPHDLRAL